MWFFGTLDSLRPRPFSSQLISYNKPFRIELFQCPGWCVYIKISG